MNTINQPAIGAHYQMDNNIYEVTTVGTVIGLCCLKTGTPKIPEPTRIH
ncbi:hypothetical protein [Pseudomonas sp. BN414]|nr:hypothetical protein [Pseudomonas sp. BN414]